MTARLIRDGYIPGYANAALRLLPEWTQWCIGQSGLELVVGDTHVASYPVLRRRAGQPTGHHPS
jgi:hypothetical protein